MRRLRIRRRSRLLRSLAHASLLCASPLLGDVTWANPTGGAVAAGGATIVQDGASLNVMTHTDRTVINWQGFSIGAGETANFLQPSATSAVLNRVVTPNNPSQIYGALNSNGNVFLINPSGIIVGPTGTINVNGFTASVLDIPDNEFLAGGEMTFRGDSTASVINQGTIAARSGSVALVGGNVINAGVITSDGGSISLATGGTVTLSDGSRFTHADIATIESGISPYAGVIRNSGTIRATGAVETGGEVYLVNPGGKILHDGTIAARKVAASGETGGKVTIAGKEVELAGATVDASGNSAGGEIHIGGGKNGNDPAIANSLATHVDADSTITAAATESGDGGDVVVWGTDEVEFHGTINTLGGDGGFAEVSTKGVGVIDGTAHTLNLLVDPGDVVITTASATGGAPGAVEIAASSLTSVLNLGGTVTINTDAVGTNNGTGRVDFGGGGNVTVNNNTGTLGTLIIHAADEINTVQVGFLSNGTTGTNYEFYAGSSATANPQSTADVVLFGQVFNTAGGYVLFDAADDVRIRDPLQSRGGDVTLIARGGDGQSTIVFGGGADGFINSTDGLGNAGTVTLFADEITVNTTANPIINADGVGGVVTLRPYTSGTAIDLGGDADDDFDDDIGLVLTDDIIDLIAANVLRIGSADGGDIIISDTISPAQTSTLSLITGGGILVVDGEDAGLNVTNIALQAADGIGDDDGVLGTVVTNLAFSNTSGDVNISNTGALTIASVDGVTTSTNTGGDVNLSAASPLTFAANVTAGGNITATADESAADVDHVTVNAGVTVQSTGGDVTLQAGDDVVLGSGSTISAAGTLTLTAGFNDSDSAGQLIIDATATLAGDPINLTSLEDFAVGVLNLPGVTLHIASTNGAITDGNDPADGTLNITAQNLTLTATNGIGGAGSTATIETSVANLEAQTTSGGIFLDNTGSLTIGGVTGALSGVSAVGGGDITIGADDLNITETINAGSGIVTLRPLTAGRTIDLGTDSAGSLGLTDAELDLVTAGILRIGSSNAGSITFTGPISPANTSTLSLITGDEVFDDQSSGPDVQVANLAIQSVNGIADQGNIILDTDIDTFAALNTTSGAISLVESFNGGDLVIGTVDGVVGVRNEAFSGSTPLLGIQIETNNGNLTVNADVFNQRRNIFLVAQQGNGGPGDRLFTNNANITTASNNGQIDIRANNMTLSPGSTISAVNRVILEGDSSSTSTIAINLGGADGVNTLGLTDAEVDTVTTAGVLQIGNSQSGDITITDAISPAGASTLALQTGGAVLDGNVGTDVAVANLAFRTGGGFGTAGSAVDINVMNLAFANTGGPINLTNVGDLTITTVDGLATSSNTGTTTSITTLAGGSMLTFAVNVSSAGDADFNSTTINVNNGVTVDTSPAGTLAFNATTVNLDGNLSAASDGISGTASTVNVISDTGGAEIQDAVDVATSGATVNVSSGTFAGGVVIDTPLTILGATFTNIDVAGGAAGMTVVAADVTIDGFAFSSTAAASTGIVLGDATNALTATNATIHNNTFQNLFRGIVAEQIAGTTTIDNVVMRNIFSHGFDFTDTAGLATGESILITNSSLTTTGSAVRLGEMLGDGSNVTIAGNTLASTEDSAVQFASGIGAATVSITDNARIVGSENGIAFFGPIDGGQIAIDGNGSATLDSAAYDGATAVDLDGFAATGAISGGFGSGIHFAAAIQGDSAVTISGNVIADGGAGVTFAAVDATQTTKVHNNFILGNAGNGVTFLADVASLVEVFQNFIADNAGDGVQIGPAANIGSGNLAVQQNFLPGAGVAHGNGGFAFNQLGAGAPDIEANWWGSMFAVDVIPMLNGVLPPSTVIATDEDTNTPATIGATGLDPFAFQSDQVIALKYLDALGEFTHDRFTRYQHFFRTVYRLLDPNSGVIKARAPTITIAESLADQASSTQDGGK